MMNVLVISYTFPPEGGIGGRRWSKFAKYLGYLNIPTHVICAKTPLFYESNDYPTWLTPIDTNYPDILRLTPKSLLGKMNYHLALAWVKYKYAGNFYDPSIFWYKSLIPKLVEIVSQQEITHVIASGGPFTFLADVAAIKHKFPSVKFIADFRDPWVNNKTSFGYDSLSESRFHFEKELQMKVLKDFDIVVSVAEQITEYFKSQVPFIMRGKFHTIHNGFDPEDFYSFTGETFTSSNVGIKKFSFIGSVYNKTQKHIEAFCSAIENFQESDFQFDFYGDMNARTMSQLSSKKNVTIHGKVPNTQAMKALSESDVGILILTDDITYSFSTKFCEYVQYKIPIWVISENGFTPGYVKENSIGIHSEPNMESVINGLKAWQTADRSEFYKKFNTGQFQISTLTESYIKLLNASA